MRGKQNASRKSCKACRGSRPKGGWAGGPLPSQGQRDEKLTEGEGARRPAASSCPRTTTTPTLLRALDRFILQERSASPDQLTPASSNFLDAAAMDNASAAYICSMVGVAFTASVLFQCSAASSTTAAGGEHSHFISPSMAER